ncbi:MAG: hypothetical protein ABIN57_04370 [Chitinophagaceae bacterium]
MNLKNLWKLLPVAVVLFAAGCTSPRNIISSGKVTPKGTFKAGFNTSFNAASAPVSPIANLTKAAVNAIDSNKDSIFYNEAVASLTKGLVAYSLDPITPTYDVYVRYGVLNRVDVGYKFASGAHAFDVMYQFLGTTGTPDDPEDPEAKNSLHGSIGFQYSGQNASLPGKVGLNRLSGLFNYHLSRKDILIPLVFSYSFGPEETYGNVSFGVVYGKSFIDYGFNPSKKLVRYAGNQVEKIPAFSNKQNYSSFGAFLNGKIGYKYAYFVPAISMYYQNYGTYNLFGLQAEKFKGVTFIPSIGVQLNFGYKKKASDY